eukprot:9527602-Lingulodinium_polyedra.AAC.1
MGSTEQPAPSSGLSTAAAPEAEEPKVTDLTFIDEPVVDACCYSRARPCSRWIAYASTTNA